MTLATPVTEGRGDSCKPKEIWASSMAQLLSSSDRIAGPEKFSATSSNSLPVAVWQIAGTAKEKLGTAV
jgi:hypothetical protein